MTNKEISAAIKADLKKAGYNTKDFRVSVRTSRYDTAARVTIKNPCIYQEAIEKLLNHWQSYEIDPRTLEVLQGGNCYLFVEYGAGIADMIPQEYRDRATAILKEKPEGVKIAENGEKSLHISCEGYRTRVTEFNGHTQKTIFTYDTDEFILAYYRFVTLGKIAA